MDVDNNLHNQYDGLKKINDLLEKEIDDKKQAIHNYKNQLSLSAALRLDFEEEIDALRSNNNKELIESKKYIKQLENERASLKFNINQQMLEKSELIESLHEQILTLKQKHIEKTSILTNEPSAETSKCPLLNEKIKNYTRNLIKTQIDIDTFEQEYLTAEENCNELAAEIAEIKKSLIHKSREIEESKETICALQEEVAAIKLELESKKNKPLDAKQRGNSMFAEIEDKYASFIKMQQNMSQFKKKCKKLEQNVSKTFKQIEEFNNQNSDSTSNQLNMLCQDYENQFEQKIETYKNDILTREAAIKEYKKDISKDCEFTGKGLSTYASGYANNIIKAKWRELEATRDSLNNISAAKLTTCINLGKSNLELFKWKRKENILKKEISNLKSALLETQLKNTDFILEEGGVKTETKSNSSTSIQATWSDNAETKSNTTENHSAENSLQNDSNRDSSELIDQRKNEYDEEELFLQELEVMKNSILNENKDTFNCIVENVALNSSLNDSFSNKENFFISERANKLMSRKSAVVGYYTLTTPDVSVNHEASTFKIAENLLDDHQY